jgi:wyosine [tRNA(Phe)-imidazoG37] synthetase (radical SAM superfamily)
MENEIKSWLKTRVDSICIKLERSILSNKGLKFKVVFGPVPSRRLGYVIGVNNIKAGVCSYDCIYCPIGKTNYCSICTNNCLSPYELHLSVKNKLEELKKNGKKIEYIIFSGSGEPTLDSNLAKEIELLREFGYKIAVYTNSAHLWNENIQQNLMFADYVSLKIDTVNEETWLKLNRPNQRLKYDHVLEGIKEFTRNFKGIISTETTLIKSYNDSPDEIEQLSKFLNSLNPTVAYFMTPRYPSAEAYAVSPSAETLTKLSEIIKKKVTNSVLLCCSENEEFYSTDDFENELLGLLAIHPVDKKGVKDFVRGEADKVALKNMIDNKIIQEVDFNGKKYFTKTDNFSNQQFNRQIN